MKCNDCGHSPVGACRTCGRPFCFRHRKRWFGRALCVHCYDRTLRTQVVWATLLTILAVSVALCVFVAT